jgi:hypothetical protein
MGHRVTWRESVGLLTVVRGWGPWGRGRRVMTQLLMVMKDEGTRDASGMTRLVPVQPMCRVDSFEIVPDGVPVSWQLHL